MLYQRIEIKPSATLVVALCLIHFGAAAAIWLAALTLWLKCGVIAAIGASLVWSLWSGAALRAAESVVALEVTAAGRFSFLTRRGTWHACEVLGTSYVSSYLAILNLRPENRRLVRHVVLVPDNVEVRAFRRLRAWLRWAPRPEPA